jgi:hypothetical protein
MGPHVSTEARPGVGLATDAIGLREVLFQSVTHMAPAAAVAFSIPFGAPFGGGSLPLAVLLALIGCLFAALLDRTARKAPPVGRLLLHLHLAGFASPRGGSWWRGPTRSSRPWSLHSSTSSWA